MEGRLLVSWKCTKSSAERDEKPIFEKEEGMTTIFQSDRAETQYIEGVLSELDNILRQNLDCSVMLTGKARCSACND